MSDTRTTAPTHPTPTRPLGPRRKWNPRPPDIIQGGSSLANGIAVSNSPPAEGCRNGGVVLLSRGDPCRFRHGGKTVTGTVVCVIPSGHDVCRVLSREWGGNTLQSVFKRNRRAVVRWGVSYVVSCSHSRIWLYPRKVEPT